MHAPSMTDLTLDEWGNSPNLEEAARELHRAEEIGRGGDRTALADWAAKWGQPAVDALRTEEGR